MSRPSHARPPGPTQGLIMDTTRFGKTGMKVSRLCLGCMTYGSSKWRSWVLDEEASMPFFKAAIEKGINFFDTADVYSQGESERVAGKALKEYAKRHEIVLATKVNGPMGADPTTAACLANTFWTPSIA